MIKLITGVPGAGKTQYALHLAMQEKRTVRCANIPLNKWPEGWSHIDPAEWQKSDPNSLILIDEAQDYMMASQKEPAAWVRELAKHRHHGLDIWLITQDPKQIHAYVRRLVGEWHNLTRLFGQNAANIDIRVGADDRKPPLETKVWPYKKEIWELYHSATVHTKHGKLPWKLVAGVIILLAASVFAFVGLTKSGVTNTKENWPKIQIPVEDKATPAIAEFNASRKSPPFDLKDAERKNPKERQARDVTGEGVVAEKTCPVLVGVIHNPKTDKTVAVFRSQEGSSYFQELPSLLFYGNEFTIKNCAYWIASGSLYTRDADARAAQPGIEQGSMTEPGNPQLVVKFPPRPGGDQVTVVGTSGPHNPLGKGTPPTAAPARNALAGR